MWLTSRNNREVRTSSAAGFLIAPASGGAPAPLLGSRKQALLSRCRLHPADGREEPTPDGTAPALPCSSHTQAPGSLRPQPKTGPCSSLRRRWGCVTVTTGRFILFTLIFCTHWALAPSSGGIDYYAYNKPINELINHWIFSNNLFIK